MANDVISQYVKEKFPEPQTVINPKMVDVEASRNAPKIDAKQQLVTTPALKIDGIIPKGAGNSNPFSEKGFYETMWNQMYKDIEPESEQARAKREKRERSRANILALADGLSSIANIWATTKGSTPMNMPSLSDVNRKRYEYAQEVRRNNDRSWRHGVMQMRIADMDKEAKESQMRYKAEKDARDEAYKKDKDEQNLRIRLAEMEQKRLQQEYENKLKADQFKETQRANKAREGIAQTNARTMQERVAQSGNKKDDGYYSIVGSNNKPIRVRKEAWKNFTGDIAQKIIDASKEKGDDSITSLIPAEFNLNPQGTLETIVSRYLPKPEFKEIEEYARKRAEELESAFTGIHTISNETNPYYNIDGIDVPVDEFEIPD